MSAQEDGSGAGQSTGRSSRPIDMSNPASPTDARHPLARVESIDQHVHRDEGLSESYQSTDTVRRRVEPQGYGTYPIS